MTLTQLYERGYALGTDAKIRHTTNNEEYVLSNVADYMWCAISVLTGDRFRKPSKFNCAFQADFDSVKQAVGNPDDWEVVV